MKNKIIHLTSGFTDSNYSLVDNVLTKKALILVEGEHTDSKKRKHTFNKERIESIVANTNTLFNQGANIPLLADHDKTVHSTLGSLESPVYIEKITEDNLPNKKAKHLIGKLGIFTNEIAIKSKSAIDKVVNNIVNTISAGLDISTDTIREISLTPTPAILGMSLYKSHLNNANFEDSSALSFEELDNLNDEMQEMQTAYEELTNKLWQLTKNIQTADEEALQGNNPNELQMQAIQDFEDKFMELIGSNTEEEQNMYQDPRMQIQRNNSVIQPPAMLSSNIPVAAFSMSDMEKLNIEFGYTQAISGAIKALGNRQKTGQTLGQIGSKFGTKMLNATKGKIAGIGRGIKKIGRVISGSGSTGSKLSNNQVKKAANAINKAGGRKIGKMAYTPAMSLVSKPTKRIVGNSLLTTKSKSYNTSKPKSRNI